MKILFISSWFPNKIEPTNGNFVQRHAEAVSSFCTVEVLHAIGDFNRQEKFIFDDQVIHNIRTLIVYYKNSKNPVQNFYRRMKAYKMGFHRLQRPDLVHANVLHNSMLFAVYLKRVFKIPFVVTEHWTALRKVNQHITSQNIRKTAKLIGNEAEMILPVSKDLQHSLQHLGIKTAMKVIPNVVDTQLFSPQSKTDSVFRFIHVSNIIPRKNAEKIMDVAVKLLNEGYDFHLQIGGDGDISELQKNVISKKLEHKIEVFGIQTLPQVAERMRKSDCFILFSDDENQPCVIAEAFASGLQVISTDVGGISEFFPENAGILLDRVEEDLLYAAMIKIMSEYDGAVKPKLAKYADDVFSQKKTGERFLEIYTKILK